jgi:hypothetical protein
MSFQKNETKRVMSNAISRFAKEFGASPNDVQILMSLDAEKDLNLKACLGYKPQKQINFNEVLGVKIDLLGYGKVAIPFLKNAISKLESENSLSRGFVFAVYQSDEVSFKLFNQDGKFLKDYSINQFL